MVSTTQLRGVKRLTGAWPAPCAPLLPRETSRILSLRPWTTQARLLSSCSLAKGALPEKDIGLMQMDPSLLTASLVESTQNCPRWSIFSWNMCFLFLLSPWVPPYKHPLASAAPASPPRIQPPSPPYSQPFPIVPLAAIATAAQSSPELTLSLVKIPGLTARPPSAWREADRCHRLLVPWPVVHLHHSSFMTWAPAPCQAEEDTGSALQGQAEGLC